MKKTTDEIKKVDDEKKWEPLWAWCALAVSSYNSFIIGGIFNCTGIVFVELLKLYDGGYVATSWLQTADFIIFTITTLTVSALITRLSLRHFLLASTLTGVSGFLVAGFAPSLFIFILGFSIISGIGRGLLYMPTAATVTTMFTSHKNLANGWYFSCSSLGGIIWPILFNQMTSYFALRGAMIILAGFWLQVGVVAAFLDPLMVKKMQVFANGPMELIVTSSKDYNKGTKLTNKRRSSLSDFMSTLTRRVSDTLDISASKRRKSEPPNVPSIISVREIGVINKAFEKSPKPAEENSLQNIDQIKAEKKEAESDQENMSQPTEGRIEQFNVTFAPDHVTTNLSKAGKLNVDPPNTSFENDLSPSLGRIYRDLVCSCIYWRHVVLHGIATNAYMTSLILFPAYATDLGLSLTESTTLLSILGVCELFSRIFYGYIGDKQWANRRLIIFVCYTMCGTGMIALTFWGGHYTAYLHVVCLSMLGGVHMVYLYPLFSDVTDSVHFGPALGLSNTLAGIFMSVSQLPLGSLRTASRSYIAPTQLLAGTYILSAINSLLSKPRSNCNRCRNMPTSTNL